MMPSLASGLLLILFVVVGQAPPSDNPVPLQPGQEEAAEAEIARVEPLALIGKEAPELVLDDLSGKPFDLSNLSEQVVVLEWTLPECRFTRRLYAQHKVVPLKRRWAKQGVRWISVNSAFFAHPIKIQPWIDKYAIKHPYVLDPTGRCAEQFGVRNSPTYLVLDRGIVVYHGALDDDVWGNQPSRKQYLDDAIRQVVEGVPVANSLTRTYGMEIRTRRTEDLRRAGLEQMRREALERESDPAPSPSDEGSTEGSGR
ncbi:MAG: redoxin domain-containing protein [Planctomycetota bacterium]|nr:redoxin domain-containing protein [Planctomycetota bacterium]